MSDKGSPIGVGVLTILTVLLVLTLAVFSALTFASAKSDLSLSKINAQTVSDYYSADSEAAKQTADFYAGTDSELEATLPMNDAQSLYIHLVRDPDGSCRTLAWKTVSADSGAEGGQDGGVNIWDGSSLPVN